MKQGWEIIPFEDSIVKVKYTSKIPSNDYLEQGLYPIVSQEEGLISGYWNSEDDVFKISSPVVIFGDHTRVLKYVDFDFVLGADGVKILQPIKLLNAKFFKLYLESCKIPSLGYSRHYKLLKELQVPVPPLPVQEQIVSELDLLSGIIEKKREQLKELDALAQSIFYDMFGDPITNEKGWEVKKLGEVAVSNMIGLTRSGTEQDETRQYLYFKMNNINNSGGTDFSKITRVDASDADVLKYSLKYGDFLFNTRNSFELVGKSCYYNNIDGHVMLFNNNIMRITFVHDINTIFITYLFQDTYIKEQLDQIKKGTTSVWAIYYKDLQNISIVTPPLPLQQQFASKIEAIERQKELIKQSISETETLFNARMQEHFG